MEYIIAPKDFPNDQTLTIIEFMSENKEQVNKEEECLSVEGSKAIFSVSSPASGLLYWLVKEGDVVPVGEVVGIVYQIGEEAALEQYINQRKESSSCEEYAPDNFTLPAFELLKKLDLDVELFANYDLVTTRDIQEFKDKELLNELERSSQAFLPINGNGKTLLVGAGKAASQILSVIGKDTKTEVIGFLDDTPEKQGAQHLGYPILGMVDEIAELLKKRQIDSILCCAGDMQLRVKTLQLALQFKLTLANAIHPSAIFDDDVQIGGGNYIGPQSFIGAQASIGYGCFISSGAIIEHHNKIGHCVTTGPANAFSGNVQIGNFCVLGSGIIVEPMVNIGHYCAIASGCVISKYIAAHSTLKKSINYLVR